MHRQVNLNAPVIYYWPFRVGAFSMFLPSLMFDSLVILVLFPVCMFLILVLFGFPSHNLCEKGCRLGLLSVPFVN